jgi:hypothetical protein
MGGGILNFENRSLIDSIYCYCTVYLHNNVACDQDLFKQTRIHQSHMLHKKAGQRGRLTADLLLDDPTTNTKSEL